MGPQGPYKKFLTQAQLCNFLISALGCMASPQVAPQRDNPSVTLTTSPVINFQWKTIERECFYTDLCGFWILTG